MTTTFSLDELISRLSAAVPSSLQTAKSDLENNFRSILQSAFAKLDLVTREEFDVQANVLARTRQKLEALEKRVTLLEEIYSPSGNTAQNSNAKSETQGNIDSVTGDRP